MLLLVLVLQAYHWYCVGLASNSLEGYSRASWRCVNCKLCEACGQRTAADDRNLLQASRQTNPSRAVSQRC